MPRPKNYAFEKAQRERARNARKQARKASKSSGEPGGDEPKTEAAPAGAATAPKPTTDPEGSGTL